MKKKFTLLLSIMLCLFCLPSAAFAAEADEMVPVVVKTPYGWDAPCLWAWADDGTNAFASWPGEELEALEDGWYYTYVPSFVQNVIVSANNDTETPVQTEGVVVEAGKEVWLTIGEDAAAEVAYESQARIEIPEYMEKFVVHAYVPLDWKTANLWAWSAPDGTNAFDAWPGLALKEGDDGWFTGNYIALGCVSAIRERGLEIPKQIAVMTFDDHPFSQIMEPPLTVVDIDVRGMGNQAGKFLLDMIRHPNTQVQTYVTTSNLMVRESTVR